MLLGLTPLLVAFLVNGPLVFDKLTEFYQDAYLKQLRYDFHDLDQHITRRQEMVRLFARLPEPAMTRPVDKHADNERLERARADYVDWANRVLFDQRDITQIIFIGSDGQLSLAMSRNPQSGLLESDRHNVDMPTLEFLSAGLKVSPGTVLTSPIDLDESARERAPNRFMTLSFISPVISPSPADGSPQLRGVVVFRLDIGGLAHFYNGIYWVRNNGEYLSDGTPGDEPASTAFRDFPGLNSLFARGKLGLWERGGQQVFWLPLFAVHNSGPLWVGRSVDKSPLEAFTRELKWRITFVVAALLLAVFLIARLMALRAERISNELTRKMTRVLKEDEPVTFDWKRPQELRALGQTLTRLSEKHAQDTRRLHKHARELEQSNRYKSEFLANVSHELRTPLNSILLLSRVLSASDSKLDEEQREQAEVIHSAGRDLRTLIDSILDLSRIEAGKTKLHLSEVKLAALLDDLVNLMRPQVEDKGLSLKLEIDRNSPGSLVSDEAKLRQILVNFLSNALKFTRQGQITLHASRSDETTDRARPIRITVSDTGIGIPEHRQADIFEAFNQVDGSTSRRYGGTGLGLTISRELASLLGGRIEVSSKPGAGSKFTLYLPEVLDTTTIEQLDSVELTEPGLAPVDEPAVLPEADYQGKRLLLVDDDMQTLLALTPMLEHWSVTVVAAGDGQEALETLQDDSGFDLILLDLHMPVRDGFDTLAQIRKSPELAGIPVVVLTEQPGGEEDQRAQACGARGSLAKPVDANALKSILDQQL